MPDYRRENRGPTRLLSLPALLLRRDLRGPLPAPQWPVGVHLRTYCPELAGAVHALLRLSHQGDSEPMPDLTTWQARFATDAESDPQLCFIACDGHGVVGVAHCWTSAYLKDLAVHPRARRQGLGHALLLHAFEVLQQRREACLDLQVLSHNHPARRLYQRAGMAPVPSPTPVRL